MPQLCPRAAAVAVIVGLSLTAAGCSSGGTAGAAARSGDRTGGTSADVTPTAGPTHQAETTAAENAKAGSAHLTYSGGATGEFTIDSVSCAVSDGKLVSINAPDVNDTSTGTPPAFVANVSDGAAMADLVTPDNHNFVQANGSGITGQRSGGTWTATVSGLTLGPSDQTVDSIVVSGTITCGSVAGL